MEKERIVVVGPPGVGKSTLVNRVLGIPTEEIVSVDHVWLNVTKPEDKELFQKYGDNFSAMQAKNAKKDAKLVALSSQFELRTLELKHDEYQKMNTQHQVDDGGLITGRGYEQFFYSNRGLITSVAHAEYGRRFLSVARELYDHNTKVIDLVGNPRRIKRQIESRRKGNSNRDFEEAYTPTYVKGVMKGIHAAIEELIAEGVIARENVVKVKINRFGDYREEGSKRKLLAYLRRNGVETRENLTN